MPKGGLLGKKLEPVVVDPASDWPLICGKSPGVNSKAQSCSYLWLLDLRV